MMLLLCIQHIIKENLLLLKDLLKLDDKVDEYNNTYHATIKMKPINVKDNIHINTLTTITTLQIGLKKYLLLKKLKILFLGLTLLMI